MKGEEGVTIGDRKIKVFESKKKRAILNNVKQMRVIIKKLVMHIFLFIGGLIMLMPFAWMISSSLKEPARVFIYPPQWIPNPITFKAYIQTWTLLPFSIAYLNSFKITLSAVVGTLLTSSMAAFAFSKLEFYGRKLIFISLLATMMIPIQVTLIPMFILFKNIGWIDTHWPLIVPRVLTNAFGVFLLRQFFMTIPDDLLDAARIDGCNLWGIYWKIMLPLSTPALATLGIFVFMSTWNDFLAPLVYLDSMKKLTVPLLVSATKGLYYNEWTILMATGCSAVMPVLIVYLFAQRYFIQGITLTGLKG